mgnify:FL=1
MGGLRMGGLRGARLSSAPVLPGARTADMAQGIERYPFQIHTVRSGLVAWVLSGADADTACWRRRLGVATAVSLVPGALALLPGSSLPSDEPGRHPVPIGRLQCGHAAMRLGWSHRMLRNPVSQVDDTMVWCEALRRAGVKGGINFEPKRKSAAARARHSLQQLVSPGAQG